jgi:hypothetical protein
MMQSFGKASQVPTSILMQPCKTYIYKHTLDLENVQRNKKKEKGATVNQHPLAHHEGRMDGKWSGDNFLFGSSSLLANHGG